MSSSGRAALQEARGREATVPRRLEMGNHVPVPMPLWPLVDATVVLNVCCLRQNLKPTGLICAPGSAAGPFDWLALAAARRPLRHKSCEQHVRWLRPGPRAVSIKSQSFWLQSCASKLPELQVSGQPLSSGL